MLLCHACLMRCHSSNHLSSLVIVAWLQSAETLAASVFAGNSYLSLIFNSSLLKLYLA